MVFYMIILIGAEKGGTGKTTFTTNIAVSLVKRGYKVLIVDTDIQGSASSWCASRELLKLQPPIIPCVQKFGTGWREQVKHLAKDYDYVIIDSGGRDSPEMREAMGIANILLIPLQPSQFDVWTIGKMEQLVRDARAWNPTLEAHLVFNRASTNHHNGKEIEEARETTYEFDDLRPLDITIYDRVAFRKAAKVGLGVSELHLLSDDKNKVVVDDKAVAVIEWLSGYLIGRGLVNDR